MRMVQVLGYLVTILGGGVGISKGVQVTVPLGLGLYSSSPEDGKVR